jgi:hypothetical protein
MNRTEHRLRLAFDPDYEAKWLELEEDRRIVRKITVKMMGSSSLILISFWTGGMVYLATRSWTISFLTPPIIWLIESAFYMWWADRKKREELGI